MALALHSLAALVVGDQNALRPAGHQADAIARHWWFFLIVSAIVYVVVAAVLLWALFRRHRNVDEARHDRRAITVVAASTGATLLIVLTLLVHAIWTGRTLGALPEDEGIHIEVTGLQWWWLVHYLHGEENQPYLTTANEIHIPVGVPINIDLKSRDVIHSFWIPNLHGKIDLIPGHTNRMRLRADRPGIYRGQCAEFCGLQHARMGFLVIAQPREEYERWLASQRQPGREPQSEEERRGRDIFVSAQCAVCHTVRGTTAFGHTGPDLTHVGSRRTLAAASIPNTRGHLAGWIADPQGVKPGNRMPASDFNNQDFRALLAYVESLR